MEPAIKVKDLSYFYGVSKKRIRALNSISLEVSRGEVFGFIGPNGAGKTTAIKHLLGIIPSRGDNVSVFGSSPSLSSSRKRLGYMPENSRYYGFLSSSELLMMYGDICRVERRILKKRVPELLDIVGLSEKASKRLSTFSKGMLQKVSFAQALINDPDLLILDEPTGGLDPVARKKMREVISVLRKRGKTVFFSSHELSEVELVADKIGVIDQGSIVAEGPVTDLLGGKSSGQTLENYFLQLIGDRE
ncbi:MAG: ABC transporter ATP-binding protein [Candidatus Omnitrophota bacterium]